MHLVLTSEIIFDPTLKETIFYLLYAKSEEKITFSKYIDWKAHQH